MSAGLCRASSRKHGTLALAGCCMGHLASSNRMAQTRFGHAFFDGQIVQQTQAGVSLHLPVKHTDVIWIWSFLLPCSCTFRLIGFSVSSFPSATVLLIRPRYNWNLHLRYATHASWTDTSLLQQLFRWVFRRLLQVFTLRLGRVKLGHVSGHVPTSSIDRAACFAPR